VVVVRVSAVVVLEDSEDDPKPGSKEVIPSKEASDVAAAGVGNVTVAVIASKDCLASVESVASTLKVVRVVRAEDVTTDARIEMQYVQ
jgi:hypothetical protein